MNILCLESQWDENSRQTVKPILDIIKNDYNINYTIYRYGDFFEFFEKFNSVSPELYDTLYIASHGEPNKIKVFSDSTDTLTLDALCDIIGPNVKDKIVHIASCGTLNVHPNHFNKVFDRLGCRILSGYIYDINWVESAASDLLYFDTLASEGIRSINDYGLFDRRYLQLLDTTGFTLKVRE